MRVKRFVLISAATVAATAGAGGAIAAVTHDDGKKTEQAILDDAAKRLNVSPDDLRKALSDAEAAQLDQAVKDGKLTQQQADAIKSHMKTDGRVLGIPPGGPRFAGPGGPGFGHGFGPGPFDKGAVLDAAATALGTTTADLRKQLQAGKSIADVAKANNKSLDDVKAAIKDAVTKELDDAVKAGQLPADARTHILQELDEHIDDIVNATPGKFRGRFAGPRAGHWR
jgi:polyhydroxyalkanoate synthesis regulator phasin